MGTIIYRLRYKSDREAASTVLGFKILVELMVLKESNRKTDILGVGIFCFGFDLCGEHTRLFGFSRAVGYNNGGTVLQSAVHDWSDQSKAWLQVSNGAVTSGYSGNNRPPSFPPWSLSHITATNLFGEWTSFPNAFIIH